MRERGGVWEGRAAEGGKGRPGGGRDMGWAGADDQTISRYSFSFGLFGLARGGLSDLSVRFVSNGQWGLVTFSFSSDHNFNSQKQTNQTFLKKKKQIRP